MTPRDTRLAAVVLGLLAIGGAILAGGMRLDRAALHFGPLRTFERDDRPWVAVFHGERLHLLDAEGRRQGVQSLAELGLEEEPTDMDIVAGPDGRLQAWFFEDTKPRIVACQLGRDLRWSACGERLAGAQLKANARSRAVHLAVDPERPRVYVADAHGGLVRAFDTASGRLVAQSPAGALFFPNRVRVQGAQLAVADNDHRRVAWLDLAGDRPSLAVQRARSALSHPQAGGTKVTDFAMVGDTLWMLAVRQGQKHGNVLVWQGDRPVARADLGVFHDPLWIDRFGPGALVGDFDGVALQRIGPRGELLGEFGSGEFAAELVAARSALGWGQGLVRAGWAWLGGAFVIGCVLAWRYGERPGAQATRESFAALAAEAGESPVGEVVLEPQAWYVRQLRRVLLVQVAISAAMLAAVGWIVLDSPGLLAGRVWPLALVAAVALLGVPLLWSRMLSGRTLVVSERAVEWRRGATVFASAPLSDVWVSPSMLQLGSKSVPYREPEAIRGPRRWIYDESTLTRYVLARVPPERRVTAADIMKRQVAQIPLAVKVLLGVAMLAAAAMQAWLMFR